MTCTLWTNGLNIYHLVPGADRPRFADGTPCDPRNRLVATIEAESWDEALRKMDEWFGERGLPELAMDGGQSK